MHTSTWDELAEPWKTAVEEAWTAYRAGSLPIGAAVVDESGAIVARGRNRIMEPEGPAGLVFGNALAHAEINALLALHETGRDPVGCVLHTTTEPCPLCVGGCYVSRLRDVRYAARDPWAGGSHLPGASPYLGRPGGWIVGPEAPALETVLVALQVEAHLRLHGAERPFLATWRTELPAGFALGEQLSRSGRLRELAADGATAAAVVDELSAASAAAA